MMISDRSSLVAAVDIGGSTTKVSLVSDRGLIGRTRTLQTPQGVTSRDFLKVLIREVKELELRGPHLGGVGIAVPGFIDDNRRSVKTCVNVSWLAGNLWINLLEEELGIPAVAKSKIRCMRADDRTPTRFRSVRVPAMIAAHTR